MEVAAAGLESCRQGIVSAENRAFFLPLGFNPPRPRNYRIWSRMRAKPKAGHWSAVASPFLPMILGSSIHYNARIMKTKALLFGLFVLVAVWTVLPAEVPEDRGAMGLSQALNRLDVVASVLHTGAHPGGENSRLLALPSRGKG